jgi:cytochrome P450
VNRLLAAVRAFRDPVGLLVRTGRQGDLVRLTGGRRPAFVVTSPDLAREVLDANSDVFLKGAGSNRLARVMGDGLQVSEGEHHRRERALMDPGFAAAPMQAHDGDVRWSAELALSGWHDGDVLEVVPAMRSITTGAVLRALFPEAGSDDVERLTGAVTEVASDLWKAAAPGPDGLKRFLLPGFGRFRRAHEAIDRYIGEALARRRSGEVTGNDVLSVMLGARLDGAGMSDTDARDEVVSLLLAGRGTITAGLAWAWFLLARNPSVESRLHEEVDSIGGGFPSSADLDRLPFTRAVWDEALRVYPPSWVLRRKAAAGTSIGDTAVPEGSTVLLNVFGLHRDARSFPEPDAFDPERFLGGSTPPAFAYLPFGAGPRGCIGFHFATMEAVLVLAGIAAGWRLEPVEATTGEPRFARSITLRSKQPLRMRIVAR